MQKNNQWWKFFQTNAITTISLVLIAVLSFWAGSSFANRGDFQNQPVDLSGAQFNARVGTQVDANLFWQVWDMMDKNYVDHKDLDAKSMFYGAIKGMVDSANDPYTIFMDPAENKKFHEDLSGQFDGIGAEIGLKDSVVTIIAPLDGMPAAKAGLKAGDQIIKIDNQITLNMTVNEAVDKIRGAKGTAVTLTIMRAKQNKPFDIKITRDTIVVKSVKTTKRSDGVFIIKVSNFNDDTDALFAQAVKEVGLANPKGIILDLRNNPGGYLDSSIKMASQWIEDGMIVSEQYGDGQKTDHPAVGQALLTGYKTVVLVNEGSASASEIVAGALKDYKKATIVGEKTYGKGSVQSVTDLNDGSAIKITTAKWLTPSGHSINKQGISPDVTVGISDADYNANRDPQLDKAVQILKAK